MYCITQGIIVEIKIIGGVPQGVLGAFLARLFVHQVGGMLYFVNSRWKESPALFGAKHIAGTWPLAEGLGSRLELF